MPCESALMLGGQTDLFNGWCSKGVLPTVSDRLLRAGPWCALHVVTPVIMLLCLHHYFHHSLQAVLLQPSTRAS